MDDASRPPAATDLFAAIEARARLLGFDAVSVARADLPLDVEFERYRAFVAEGKHGKMGYLAENIEARRALSGDAILPGAKSVLCLARSYRRDAREEAHDPPLAKRVARYARGHDYHNHLRKQLRALARFVKSLGPGVRARPLLDEEPVLERVWAARAGLGFVGKHGLLIVPGLGSMVLLGEVVTTLELAPHGPIEERCGSCTRCLEACPTSAFDAPFRLDPRRCVAYLTIEAPEEQVDGAASEHLFGCDDCQTACPFNQGQVRAQRLGQFAPLPVFRGLSLADLLRVEPGAFSQTFQGSPLLRAGQAGLAKNALRVARARLLPGSGATEAERKDAEEALGLARQRGNAAARGSIEE